MSRIVICFSDRRHEHLFRAITIAELLADHHDLLLIVPHAFGQRTRELCSQLARVELFILPAQKSSVLHRNRSLQYGWVATQTCLSLAENKVQRFAPDLLVSVSEGLLPRIAKRLSVRCIRVDCQDLAEEIDLRELPYATRLRFLFNKLAKRVVETQVDQQLVTSLLPCSERPGSNLWGQTAHRRVGILLRKELQKARSRESHLLVNASHENQSWIRELVKIKLPAKVYGQGGHDPIGDIQFRDSTVTFAEDFLSCAGVVTDVGSQLIGEALACGKHVLAIPDPTDYHQQIGAIVLSKRDCGGIKVSSALTADLVSDFYFEHDLSSQPVPAVQIANEEVKSLIELQLQ